MTDEKYGDLKKEFNIVKELEHENIIKYICLIPVKQAELKNQYKFGLVMEYAEKNLAEICKKTQTQTTKMSYINQMVQSLKYLHSNKLMHRDFKPANIMRMKDGKLKVIDFSQYKKVIFLKKSFIDAIALRPVGTCTYFMDRYWRL